MASSGGDNNEEIPTSGVVLATGDEGESHIFRDEPRRCDHSLAGLVEYIGTIRKEMRKFLPRLLDLTLLRLLGVKVQDSVLGLGLICSQK